MVAINIAENVPQPPPRRSPGRPRKNAVVQPPAPMTEAERRTQGLMGLGQLGQGILLIAQQYADAATVGQHWPNVAPELGRLADQHEWLAKPIDLLIAVGPFGALIAAALPMGLQLAANHKLVDASNMIGQGVVPPEVLEAQMKAQVAQMQAEAMRAQQEAMRDARRAQAEYEAAFADNQPVVTG